MRGRERRWRYVVLMVAVATVGAVAGPQAQAGGGSVAQETINTLSYFLNTHGQALAGTHPMSQTTEGQKVHNVKWADNSFETYTYDDAYIYLREDHSGAPNPGSYTFSNGKWMRRSMRIGERIVVLDNGIQNFTVNAHSCNPTTSGLFPYRTTLLAHVPGYDLGGTMGIQDVIVLQYDYRNDQVSDYEKMYYARGWGMVKWELYRGDSLIQTSIFNQRTTSPPTPPDLQVACLDTPVPTPPIPATLEEFVTTLYRCVLDKAPDPDGFRFWLDDLRRGALTIQGAYTEFFGYQEKAVPRATDDRFTRSLFACILFRPVDQESYDNVMAGLADGSLTRPQLVQYVLDSAEFTSGILPRLRMLA